MTVAYLGEQTHFEARQDYCYSERVSYQVFDEYVKDHPDFDVEVAMIYLDRQYGPKAYTEQPKSITYPKMLEEI